MDARLNYYGNPVGEKFQKYLNSAGRAIASSLPPEPQRLCIAVLMASAGAVSVAP